MTEYEEPEGHQVTVTGVHATAGSVVLFDGLEDGEPRLFACDRRLAVVLSEEIDAGGEPVAWVESWQFLG